MSSTPGPRTSRTLFLLGLWALFLGLIAPIAPAAAAETFTTPPQVSIDIREPTVGDVLTAVLDTETVPAADTYTYQWYAHDTFGQVLTIPGATDQKYTVTDSNVGRKLQVIVTAHKAGYSDEVDIADPTGVVKRTYTSSPEVSIDNTTPKIGDMVSAVLEKDSVPAGNYSYQWYRDDGVHEPQPIYRGNSAAYIVTNYDAGSRLRVRVTAYDRSYYDAFGWSASTAIVEKGNFTADPVPVITDTTPTVGQPIGVMISPSSPEADFYAIQWRADGVAIVGATLQSFTPTLAEGDKVITVSVTPSTVGYNDGKEVTSAPTEAVFVPIRGFTSSGSASLNTTAPKVGTVLRVTMTGGSPTPDSYTYEWQKVSPLGVRTTIVGAIGSEYTVPFADRTYRLRVRVTAHKAGYDPMASPTVWTDQVDYIALNKTTVVRGQTLGVTAKRMRIGQAYRIYIDGVMVYKGAASSSGSAIRTVGVPKTIGTGTKRVWVSGYRTSGVRDFQVMTTVVVK